MAMLSRGPPKDRDYDGESRLSQQQRRNLGDLGEAFPKLRKVCATLIQCSANGICALQCVELIHRDVDVDQIVIPSLIRFHRSLLFRTLTWPMATAIASASCKSTSKKT